MIKISTPYGKFQSNLRGMETTALETLSQVQAQFQSNLRGMETDLKKLRDGIVFIVSIEP